MLFNGQTLGVKTNNIIIRVTSFLEQSCKSLSYYLDRKE